jgi:hypothetical protein
MPHRDNFALQIAISNIKNSLIIFSFDNFNLHFYYTTVFFKSSNFKTRGMYLCEKNLKSFYYNIFTKDGPMQISLTNAMKTKKVQNFVLYNFERKKFLCSLLRYSLIKPDGGRN